MNTDGELASALRASRWRLSISAFAIPASVRKIISSETFVSRTGIVLFGALFGFGITVAPLAMFLALAAVAGASLILASSPALCRNLLYACPLLVLLADTKFRIRDIGTTLAGRLDLQVAFELALYSGLALVAMRGFAPSRLRNSLNLNAIEGLLLAHAGLAVLSTTWSSAPQITLVRALQQLVLVGVSMSIVRFISAQNLIWSLRTSLLTYTNAAALLALFFPWAAGSLVELNGLVRFSWFAVHPVWASGLAALTILLVFLDVLFSDSRFKTTARVSWALLSIVLPILTIVWSHSRTYAIALTVTVIFLLNFISRRWVAPAFVVLLSLTGAIFTIAGPTISDLFERGAASSNPVAQLLYRGQSSEELLNLTGRTASWPKMMSLWSQQPFLGHGFQASRAILPDVLGSQFSHPHNALMQSLLDLGILGTILLFVPLVIVILNVGGRQRVRGENPEAPLAAIFALLTFLLIASITATTFAGSPGFAVFLFQSCLLLGARVSVARTWVSDSGSGCTIRATEVQ